MKSAKAVKTLTLPSNSIGKSDLTKYMQAKSILNSERKYTLAWAVLILTGILTWQGKVSDVVYGWAVVGVVGAYITGNVIQKKFVKPEGE